MRRLALSLLVLAAVGVAPMVAAGAQGRSDRVDVVEVVEVKGIIDGSVERAVLATLRDAERRGDGTLVVLQIDSRGVVDGDRTWRMVEALHDSEVPVLTWVGPPGASAANGAALLATAGDIPAAAPGTIIGPLETTDLRRTDERNLPDEGDDAARWGVLRDGPLDANSALDAALVRFVEPSIQELFATVNEVGAAYRGRTLSIDEEATIRFHKLDLWGRLLHAAAQPSMVYLFLLLALVGIVFELFHPSTGPAGVAGLAALALSIYGAITLGASWLGSGLIVAGVVAFAIDLRYESVGLFTTLGFGGLVAGSLLLFPGPYLRVDPWLLAFGIVSMTMFLLGAMTRVLRDLREIARGELEVTDAHPHPEDHAHNGQGGTDGS